MIPDQTREQLGAVLAAADEVGVSMPPKADLEKLGTALAKLGEGKEWQQIADKIRQEVERYLEDNDLPLTVAPVLAGILTSYGESRSNAQARFATNVLMDELGGSIEVEDD